MPTEVQIADFAPAGNRNQTEEKMMEIALGMKGGDVAKASRWVDSIYSAPELASPFALQGAGGISKAAGGSGGGWGEAAEILNKMLQNMPDVAKEIDFNFANAIPSALGFNLFDLSGPARATDPMFAPIRGRIARTQINGPAHLAKVLTSVSGAGVGGLADVNPAFPLNVPTAGSNIEAARGNEISYASRDVIIQAKWHALRTGTQWPAFFAGQGFQDLRAMGATLLLRAHMNLEEKAIAWGRDTVLAAPGTLTANVRTAVGSEVGLADVGGGHTKLYVKATAIGHFSAESAPSAALTVTLSANSQVADITVPDVTGALGYRIYASRATNGGADPGDASRFFYGTTGYNVFTLGADGITASTSAVPVSDTGSGGSDNFRGITQIVEEGPAAGTSVTGYSKRVNAKPSGASVTMFQDMFRSMFASWFADPDEIWLSNRENTTIADLIIGLAGSAPYRVSYQPDQQDGIIAGIRVPGVMNESSPSGKVVPLRVHPFMPVGNALCLSYATPFPTAFGQTNVFEMVGPQDVYQVSWPATTMRWETSVLWYMALAMYAPQFCGVLHGIASETDATKGRLQ